MAGAKGRSGGARANAGGARVNSGGARDNAGGPRENSGGARPGAGRKAAPKPPPVKVERDDDMLVLLQKIALGHIEATTVQVRAAIAAVQYTHTKRGDGGKKEEAVGKAKQAASGRFGAAPPPRLVASGGVKV